MKRLLLKTMLLLCALIVGSSSLWADITWTRVTSVQTLLGGGTFIMGYETTAKSGVIIPLRSVDCGATTSANGIFNSGTTANSSTDGTLNMNNLSGITTSDYEVYITASTTSGYINIQRTNNSGNYYGASSGGGSKNTARLYAAGNTNETNLLPEWANESNNQFKLKSAVSGTYKYLKYNTGSPRFAFYNSAGEKIVFYKKVETTASGTTAAPTISGTTPFLNSTNVTISNAATADGASIYYTLNGDNPTTTTSATCFEYTAPFSIDATTTVKAIAKKSTDTNASSVVEKTFTKITPMTVAQAIAATNALTGSNTLDDQYVTGVVSEIESVAPDNKGQIKYYISDDGTTNNQLYVFKGKGLNNTAFTAISELEVGDIVVVFGQLKMYNSAPEINEGNYIVYKAQNPAPSFSLDVTEKSLDAYTHETVDVTLTTNTDGVVSCESSNEDVATVALKSAGVYTITAQSEGTATITIKSTPSANYKPASATVAITVTDNRADAGISFDEDEIEKTWGDSFTGQELNNANSLAVTYSSTNEAVATVSSTGVVTMKKAGTTTIKATFAGNATHKAAVASYDLTINKAEVELSFAETAFDIPLNGSGFVAPALVNPHNLAVTYSSSNTDIATINSSTGAITELVTTAIGSTTITAYYAGDDCYNGGNAKYTITIYDPNAKGTKVNPYTVAEVQDLTENLSDVYITGYIVGCVSNNKCYKTTTASLVNANILLADTPDKSFTEGGQISTESGLCPVELPTSPATLREKWGLKDNNVLGYKVICKGTEQAYFGKRGMKSTSEITAVAVPVTVTAAGLATFVSDSKLDFENVENLEAYIAKENNSKIELTKVNKVAAATGVLLRALNNATTFEVPVTTEDADDATGNLFVRGTGAAVESDPAAGGHNYILSKKGDVYGFYHANGNMVAKNRAYLHTDVAAARIDLNFDDATGINEVKSEKTVEGIFDLQGRKVVTPSKGLYIVNGKKVVIK